MVGAQNQAPYKYALQQLSKALHSRPCSPQGICPNHAKSLQENQEPKQVHMRFSLFLWVSFLKILNLQTYPELQQKNYIHVLEFSLSNTENMDKSITIF